MWSSPKGTVQFPSSTWRQRQKRAALHQTPPPLPSLPSAHLAQWAARPTEHSAVTCPRGGSELSGGPRGSVYVCSVSASACISVNRRSEHGGVSQREHQPAGFSLSQAPAGRDRWASARITGGHFHHAQIRPGRRPPQLPLGLRESRGHPQRIDRGAGGHFLSINSIGMRLWEDIPSLCIAGFWLRSHQLIELNRFKGYLSKIETNFLHKCLEVCCSGASYPPRAEVHWDQLGRLWSVPADSRGHVRSDLSTF